VSWSEDSDDWIQAFAYIPAGGRPLAGLEDVEGHNGLGLGLGKGQTIASREPNEWSPDLLHGVTNSRLPGESLATTIRADPWVLMARDARTGRPTNGSESAPNWAARLPRRCSGVRSCSASTWPPCARRPPTSSRTSAPTAPMSGVSCNLSDARPRRLASHEPAAPSPTGPSPRRRSASGEAAWQRRTLDWQAGRP